MADDTESAAGSALTVDAAQQMYEDYKTAWNEIYREALIDLKMAAGDPNTHWGEGWAEDPVNKGAGKARPVINELPQFINQVSNDIRQNTPSIRIIPATDGDQESAEVIEDLVRDVQARSGADEVYDTAAEYAVTCSIGFIRVDHDYCNDGSDNQELWIKRVSNPLSTWIDPASIECDGRDAMGAISLETISENEFKRLYKGKKFVSFTEPKSEEKKTSIVIAEIFVKEVTGERPNEKITIRRYKFSGADILAETVFPGDYVPIIPVYGKEIWIDGKRKLLSLIRNSRDPQRRLNHWALKESQLLSMAPIAPIMAVEGTIANERNQWQKPGEEMVLEYRQKDPDGEPAPPPQRLAPPAIPTGIINAMQGAKENIKESMGIYQASLGAPSNEHSGVAINARKLEGDVATLHFADNLRRSITQVGRVVDSARPIIYDTPRILQLTGEDGATRRVAINGHMPLPEGQKRGFDLTKGRNNVRVTTGASYTTKRQEEADFLMEVSKQNPKVLDLGGDLMFASMDSPGSQALAKRWKKTIPPQLLEDDDQAPSPQMLQMAQQMQEMKQLIQTGAQELQVLQAKLADKTTDQQIKRDELLLKNKELDIKAREVELRYSAQPDKEQMLMQHLLDEQAADNQLDRDLLQEAISAPDEPQPIPGAQAAHMNPAIPA